ncbi:ladinin-1 [Rhinophrynus dorsalis]
MSISRGNWSALSRLAKQWSEDDEEEQIRERRRRNRVLSNTADRGIEYLPEEDKSSLHSSEEERILGKESEQTTRGLQNYEALEEVAERQESDNQKEESQCPRSTVQEVHSLPRSQHEEHLGPISQKKESYGDGRQMEGNLCVKKEESHVPNCTSQEKQRPNSQKEENQGVENQTKASHVANTPFKETQQPRRQRKEIRRADNQETSKQATENQELRDERQQRSDTMAEDTNRFTQVAGSSSSAPSKTRISSVVVTDSSPPPDAVPGNSPASSSSSGSTSRFKSQVFVSSVKISRQKSCSEKDEGHHEVNSLPAQDKTEDVACTVSRTVKRAEVRIPSLSRSPSSKEDELPTSPPAASSFKRFSPRTSSFRVISQTEDKEDNGLTRSSHLRFSLRSRKIEDRMEKYASAVQRSVKIPSAHSRTVVGPSDGIASKRSIFEKDETSTEICATNTKKDLTLPGAVSSRINQWVSKTQEASSSGVGTKDIRTGDVANKRNLWQQRSQTSSDTKH